MSRIFWPNVESSFFAWARTCSWFSKDRIGMRQFRDFRWKSSNTTVSPSHKICGISSFGFIIIALLQARMASGQSNQSLTLRISSETAPVGATAQVKVFLSSPFPIASGSVAFQFDNDGALIPTITATGVFGATGDISGIQGPSNGMIVVQFASPTGGLARSPDLPLIELTVIVDKPHVISVFADQRTFFADLTGAVHLLTPGAVQPGEIAVGGTLSVESVTPGGGLLPTGTMLQVAGTGFNPATVVAVDGVSIAAPQFVSANLLQVNLAAPTELTGKHVQVQNPDGQQVDYWPWLQNPQVVPPSAVLPVFPLIAVTAANLSWEPIPAWS